MGDWYTIQLILNSPNETEELAKTLAPICAPGNVFLLSGDVGSGKTHFARALIQERLSRSGQLEDVPSPTYTLVQTYWDGFVEIWHTDLYRLTDPSEILELGLVDAFDSAICLVEWPDRLLEYRPDSPISLGIETGLSENARKITISANAAVHPEIVSSLKTFAHV